jgi:preprotein translocase subunit SecG
MSGFMTTLVSGFHIVSCVALVVSILLQSGKGGGLAGAFGAGSSQTLFGGRGAATFLTRASTALAVIFFITSLTLGLTASRATGPTARSLIQEEAKRRADQQTAPAPAPGTTAPAPASTGAVVPMEMTPAPQNPPPSTSPAPSTQPGGAPQGSGGTK